MSNEAARFREKAENCRQLAREAREEVSRRQLTDIASELDAEADKIEAEERGPDMPLPPIQQ